MNDLKNIIQTAEKYDKIHGTEAMHTLNFVVWKYIRKHLNDIRNTYGNATRAFMYKELFGDNWTDFLLFYENEIDE